MSEKLTEQNSEQVGKTMSALSGLLSAATIAQGDRIPDLAHTKISPEVNLR